MKNNIIEYTNCLLLQNAKGNTTPAMSNRIPTAAEESAPPVDLGNI